MVLNLISQKKGLCLLLKYYKLENIYRLNDMVRVLEVFLIFGIIFGLEELSIGQGDDFVFYFKKNSVIFIKI